MSPLQTLDPAILRRVTDGMVALPTLPLVASRLLEAVARDEAASEEVARIIALDPSLTARTLRLANSEFYGFPRKVGTVDLAVVVLGSATIRDLVLSASVLASIDGTDCALEGLWNHSMAAAVAARFLADRTQYRHAGEAYAAGLLHDIGKVVLRQTDSRRFQAVLALAREQGEPMEAAERGLFGSSHAQVGAWLAERWGLPADLVEAIATHHQPEKARGNRALASLVHLADSCAERAGHPWPQGVEPHPVSPAAWETVEPDERRRDSLIAELVPHVVRETQREQALFAEFRGSQEG
jgi:putative nucleotidyltransferase with HDIG domain